MPTPRKRTSEKLGHSKGRAEAPELTEIVLAGEMPPPPVGSKEWHPYAASWFKALKLSPMAKWYTPADWMTAFLAAELLSDMLDTHFTAGLLAEFNDMSSRLLVAEGDRRRAKIELVLGKDRDKDEEASVTAISDWQERMKLV